MAEREQLAALARLGDSFDREDIDYWLFGGWAVDFHAGSVTRVHDDLDIAVWAKDIARIDALLAADDWSQVPDERADGYTVYQREGVRLELAFLARDDDGLVYTPLREGRGSWPTGAFRADRAELAGVEARLVSLQSLKADKSEQRDDPVLSAKDRADTATLSRISEGA